MGGWVGSRAVLSVDTFYNVDKCELLWPINSSLIYGLIILGLSVVRNGAVSVPAEGWRRARRGPETQPLQPEAVNLRV